MTLIINHKIDAHNEYMLVNVIPINLEIANASYVNPIYRNNLSPWMREEIAYCDSNDLEEYVEVFYLSRIFG
jgi:hypothetical protein